MNHTHRGVFQCALILSLGAAALGEWGCFGGGRPPVAPQPKDPMAMAAPVRIEMLGKPMVCGATGQTFEIGPESRAAIFMEQVVYFIDEQALQAFLKSPEEYQPDPPIR